MADVRKIYGGGAWIEGEAERQLQAAANLPGMEVVAGFPDLHPGKGGPVGAAMFSRGIIYPYLVGSDSGCAVALYGTGIMAAKAKPEKWAKRLEGLELPWDGDARAWLSTYGIDVDMALSALGTIGHGNHFAELQRLDETLDAEVLATAALDPRELVLVVHSGSRSVGEMLLRGHVDRHKDGGLSGPELEAYLAGHANACKWAQASRDLIAMRLLDQIGGEARFILDRVHNSITETNGGYLHRKGAAPSTDGLVMVPGSRGSKSYLVRPTGPQEHNLWSLAHGAGRKWARSECEGRLRERHTAESLQRTKLGSYVICEDKSTLYEESPEAYKQIDGIIADMVEHGLISVVASFVPMVTYKVRRHP